MLSHSIPDRNLGLLPLLRAGRSSVEPAQTNQAMPRRGGDGHLQAIVTKHLLVRQSQGFSRRRPGLLALASAVSVPLANLAMWAVFTFSTSASSSTRSQNLM